MNQATLPSKIGSWMMALRIRTLPIPTIQVLAAVGSAYALTGLINGWTAFCTCLIGIFITVGTNLINDVYDYERGGDRLGRLGPMKVIRAGLLSSEEVKLAGLFALGIAVFYSFFLGAHSGWGVSLLVLLSAVMGYCYTGGPFPICYLGLSECFVFIFYGGVCVLTSFYLQTGTICMEVVLLAVQLGCLVVIPNALNNFRDIYEDAEVNRRTLAVRFGKRFARFEITALMIIPFLLSGFWLLLGHLNAFLAPFLLLPLVILFIRSVWKNDPGPQFVRYFKLSVLIHFAFGSLVTGGLLWSYYN